ncbi:unnamed protein product [Cochlearia groenlandica]
MVSLLVITISSMFLVEETHKLNIGLSSSPVSQVRAKQDGHVSPDDNETRLKVHDDTVADVALNLTRLKRHDDKYDPEGKLKISRILKSGSFNDLYYHLFPLQDETQELNIGLSSSPVSQVR